MTCPATRSRCDILNPVVVIDLKYLVLIWNSTDQNYYWTPRITPVHYKTMHSPVAPKPGLLSVKAGFNIRIAAVRQCSHKKVDGDDFPGILVHIGHCGPGVVYLRCDSRLALKVISQFISYYMLAVAAAVFRVSHGRRIFCSTFVFEFIPQQFEGNANFFEFCMYVLVIWVTIHAFHGVLVRIKQTINLLWAKVPNIFVADSFLISNSEYITN